MARTIDVTISVGTTRSVARIDFVDDGGRHVSRMVSGETCSDVVAGIALVTALAIESRVPEIVDKSEPAASPTGDEMPPTAAPPAAAPKAAVPPVAPAAAPETRRHSPPPAPARPREYHFDVGVAGALSSGIGPVAAFGGRFIAGLGWRRGPDLRIGIDYLTM